MRKLRRASGGALNQLSPKSASVAARREEVAKLELSTLMRNSACAMEHAAATMAQGAPSVESASLVADLCARAQRGDLSQLIAMLAAQALTLDAAFTDFSRRAFLTSGEFLPAADIYSRIALKAQAQCRTTVETLARLKRGGLQTVKVIHMHEGAQAIVAHTINQGGSDRNARKQPHAKEPNAPVASLQSPDEAGQQLLVPSHKRKAPVPDARREKSWRSSR